MLKTTEIETCYSISLPTEPFCWNCCDLIFLVFVFNLLDLAFPVSTCHIDLSFNLLQKIVCSITLIEPINLLRRTEPPILLLQPELLATETSLLAKVYVQNGEQSSNNGEKQCYLYRTKWTRYGWLSSRYPGLNDWNLQITYFCLQLQSLYTTQWQVTRIPINIWLICILAPMHSYRLVVSLDQWHIPPGTAL